MTWIFFILSYSQRPGEYYKREMVPYTRVIDDVTLIHVKQMCDESQLLIVLSLHWGEECLNYPSCSRINFAHSLVDAAVNLMLGHHPQVLQGVEPYKRGVIVYSLGYFFDCRLNHDGVIDYELMPILISCNCHPEIVSEKHGEKILKCLNGYTKALKNIESGQVEFIDWDQCYQEVANKTYLKFRIQGCLYSILHIYKYKLGIVFGSFFRFVQRCLGLA